MTSRKSTLAPEDRRFRGKKPPRALPFRPAGPVPSPFPAGSTRPPARPGPPDGKSGPPRPGIGPAGSPEARPAPSPATTAGLVEGRKAAGGGPPSPPGVPGRRLRRGGNVRLTSAQLSGLWVWGSWPGACGLAFKARSRPGGPAGGGGKEESGRGEPGRGSSERGVRKGGPRKRPPAGACSDAPDSPGTGAGGRAPGADRRGAADERPRREKGWGRTGGPESSL
jgi:hypothetical protein